MNKMRLLYITDKSLVGCSYFRCILPALTMENVESLYSPIPDKDQLLWADLVVQQRNVGNFKWVIKFCKQNKIPILFENDDNDFCIPDDNAMGEVFRNSGWLDDQKKVLKDVDGVITTTRTLKDLFSKYNKHVDIIPNALDLELPVWNLPKEKHAHIEVGYATGSSHLNDIALLKDVIPVREINPKVIICLCGFDTRVANFRTVTQGGQKMTQSIMTESFIDNIWVKYLENFSEAKKKGLIKIKKTKPLSKYPEHYTTFDIGVAPLTKNTFIKYKSNLKFLELGAYSIPGVFSAETPFECVEHGVDGFLANTSEEWKKYLNILVEDKDLRIKMGKAARKKVEEQFEVRVINKKRHEVYKQTIERVKGK